MINLVKENVNIDFLYLQEKQFFKKSSSKKSRIFLFKTKVKTISIYQRVLFMNSLTKSKASFNIPSNPTC